MSQHRQAHQDQVHIGPDFATKLHIVENGSAMTLTIEQNGVCVQLPVQAQDLAYAERLFQKARARLDEGA